MYTAQAFELVDQTNTAYYMVGIEYKFVSLLTSCGYSTLIENYTIYLN